jgi:hypothetical protein
MACGELCSRMCNPSAKASPPKVQIYLKEVTIVNDESSISPAGRFQPDPRSKDRLKHEQALLLYKKIIPKFDLRCKLQLENAKTPIRKSKINRLGNERKPKNAQSGNRGRAEYCKKVTMSRCQCVETL